MRRRILAAIAVVLMAAAGAVLAASPAQAYLNCDVPDPPAACFPASFDPTGTFDSAKRVPAGIQVSGTAQDIDGGDVRVNIIVGTTLVGYVVAPEATHTFSGTVPASVAGSQVCATAVNNGDGASKSLGCKSLTISLNPLGTVDTVADAGSAINVTGWALDQDTYNAVNVQIYRDGGLVSTVAANAYHSGIDAAYPGYGDYHGFSTTIPQTVDGTHTVCVNAVNVGAGATVQLKCLSYTAKHEPFGSLDSVTRSGTSVRVVGWAADPDQATTATSVRISIDGTLAATATANVYRSDVGTSYPAYGSYHGFDVNLPANMASGSHNVCVDAVNLSYGTRNTSLGCKSYGVPQPVAAPTIDPPFDWQIAATSIDLGWTDNSPSTTTGFRIERSDAGGTYHQIADLSASQGAYTDSGLTPGTQYCYHVIAYNEISQATASACYTTKLPPIPAATNLTTIGRTDTSITIKWTDNADNEDNYQVSYQSGSSGAVLTVPAHAGTGDMTYTITGLSPTTEYTIGVMPTKAGYQNPTATYVDAWTNGPPTIELFTSSPAQISACSPTAVTLSWKTLGATRVKVTQGSTVLSDQNQATQAEWSGTTDGGTNDGNVTYTITAYSADGRTDSKTVSSQTVSQYRLEDYMVFNNYTQDTLEVWYYTLDGYQLQKVGDLPSGYSYTVVPEQCTLRRIVVLDPTSGYALFDTNQPVLGYRGGYIDQYSFS